MLRAEAQFPDHLFGTSAHAFPERHGFARVVARLRHQSQSDVVRFRFLLAIERQRHIDTIGPQYTLDGASPCLPSRRGADRTQLSDLIDDAPAHSLDSMTLQRMRHFMAYHCGQPCFAFRYLEQSGKLRHFPARQRKGVDRLVVLNHGEFPLILRLVRALAIRWPTRWTMSFVSLFSLKRACRNTSR